MLQTMSKVLAKVKDYAITEEMLNETVDALRTQQHYIRRTKARFIR